MNPSVDHFIASAGAWREEYTALRAILLDCPVEETLKWGVPCYTFKGKNVVLMHGFKSYCALLFVKGALLKDAAGILVQQTENVQAARQVRFTGVQEIVEQAPMLKAYILEATELEKAGAKVPLKKTTEFTIPDEFRRKMEEMPGLQKAFHTLTPGRQRAYLLHFAEPKQEATRQARIEKWLPMIFEGKGMNDSR